MAARNPRNGLLMLLLGVALGAAVLATGPRLSFVSVAARRGFYRSPSAATRGASRALGSVQRAAGLTVSDLAERLRQEGLPVKTDIASTAVSGRIGNLLADLLEELDGAWGTGEVAKGEEEQQGVETKGEPDEGSPEWVFAQLLELDPSVNKEDYFDAESMEWDRDGLEEDLRVTIIKASNGAAGGESAPAEKDDLWAELRGLAPGSPEGPEQIFDRLQLLDPTVDKEDYFDAESMEWDREGLQEDLRVTMSKDPESLLVEIQMHDPQASKEDYYDEESEQWDLEGLQEDLQVCRERAMAVA